MNNDSGFFKAYEDLCFMQNSNLLGVKMQLEILKTQSILGNKHTISVYGSARICPKDEAKDNPTLKHWSKYYNKAVKFAELFYRDTKNIVLSSGGGPGIMKAVSEGAAKVNQECIGFSIQLPFEVEPNEFNTTNIIFNYFATRKMAFTLNSVGHIAFPGGCGTQDEFWNVLTLIDTQKIPKQPIVLFGSEYWNNTINFKYLIKSGLFNQKTYDCILITDCLDESIEWLIHGRSQFRKIENT